jgi:hypothetical protein
MTHRAIVSFNPRRCSGMSPAIFVAFLAISVNAARADCVLPDNNMTLARVVTKEAKLYFVSGPRKQAPECPSNANACRLNAYLVPGDEVLTNATDDRYVCAKFKSQSFVETIGYLPRASLELVLPITQVLKNGMALGGETQRQRLSSSPSVPKSLSWVARLGAAAIRSVSKGAPYTQANSKAPSDHGVECLPSVMTPIDQDFRQRRMQRRRSAPPNSS